MNRFLCVLALCVLPLNASAQSAATTTHTVSGGDTLYGIVAQYYPEKMVRWTDVAVDIVALNPDAFPEGLDTVMKLGDELVLVDYDQPLDAASTNTAAEPQTTDSAIQTTTTAQTSYSVPDSNLDSVTPATPVKPVGTSSRKDPAPTANDNSTASTAAPSADSNKKSKTQEPDSTGIAIGRVASVTQRALAIDHNNQQRPLAKNDDVYPGDAITTGENSTILIHMLDDAEFHLQPSSRLMFERYQYNLETHRGSAIMTLVKGGFGTTSGLLGVHQPEAITVNTAVATVGVRGTQFALRVCARNTCRNSNGRSLEPGLYTGVIEGSIVISNNTGDLVTRRGEFFHVAAPNTVPEAAQNIAALLFSAEQLALLDVKVEEEKPLGFLSWLKRKVFGD